MGAYDTPSEKCPYCGAECEADWVDVDVGMVQCGPYHCVECGASEIGPEYEKVELSDKEKKTGWYDPSNGLRVSPHANTVDGKLVDHKTAKELYDLGLLDEK